MANIYSRFTNHDSLVNMGTTRNLIFGNTVNHLPCTVYQSETQVARERSVYSRFTNHDSPVKTDIALLTPYIGGNAVYTARAIMGIDPDAKGLIFGSFGEIGQIQSDSTITCTIYPNPAKNEITVEYSFDENTRAVIAITNILGSTLLEKPINGTNKKMLLDISNLSNGIYVYTITINGRVFDKQKLVINR